MQMMLEKQGSGTNALQAEADSGTSEEAAQPPMPTRTCNDEAGQPPKKLQRKDELTVVLNEVPINEGLLAITDNKKKTVYFVSRHIRTCPHDRNAF